MKKILPGCVVFTRQATKLDIRVDYIKKSAEIRFELLDMPALQ